jgi:hypothetical protein
MYDWLLFLHVIAAFMLATTVVTFSAMALGAVGNPAVVRVSNLFWDIGGIGTLVLGVALAIDVDEYEVWDGWIIGAIVLWALSAEAGRRAGLGIPGTGDTGDAEAARRARTLHWVRALLVLALLALMIWKPGA